MRKPSDRNFSRSDGGISLRLLWGKNQSHAWQDALGAMEQPAVELDHHPFTSIHYDVAVRK